MKFKWQIETPELMSRTVYTWNCGEGVWEENMPVMPIRFLKNESNFKKSNLVSYMLAVVSIHQK